MAETLRGALTEPRESADEKTSAVASTAREILMHLIDMLRIADAESASDLHLVPGHRPMLSINTLITGDFAAGAVMITFGAVLGKTNPLQVRARITQVFAFAI